MKRSKKLGLIAFAVVLVAASAFIGKHVKLVWNGSASVPIGLYRITATDHLAVGDLVLVKPPKTLGLFLDRRNYLPENVMLLKHVAALSGQTVCRHGQTILIDWKPAAISLIADGHGRILPVWSGCITLVADQVFLLNAAVKDSLDGRYFGPLPQSTIIGRASPIFTRD